MGATRLANDGALRPKSLFAKAGVDVEVRLIRGSKERLKAFATMAKSHHAADAGLPGEPGAAFTKQKGRRLRSFLLVD